MKAIWRSIVRIWQEYRVEIKRYGIALLLLGVALKTERYPLALFILAGTVVMFIATTWGEKYRIKGEAIMEERKQARKSGHSPKPKANHEIETDSRG